MEQEEQPHKQKESSWTDLPVMVGLLWEPWLCQNPSFRQFEFFAELRLWLHHRAGAVVYLPFASFLSAGAFLLLELPVPQKSMRLLLPKTFLKISWKYSSGLWRADDNRNTQTGFLLLVCDLLHNWQCCFISDLQTNSLHQGFPFPRV